ncbi:MAG: RAMP superfamily CRISPR-associated protein [Gracilibacteraceae bacterium]|jgi:CRISPR/Cas system CSM-associated protein Csm3 (group 7 of RAMP superfamily)|nr:RAMP superfamily CRISPR-associated protein [Gracilibacteraceae bacterium]
MKENPNPVIKRVLVVGAMKLAAPALIGQTENMETDRDVAVNKDGFPYLPGTTLAGILRGTLAAAEANLLFGWAEKQEATQSPLWVYDSALLFKKDADPADGKADPANVITIDGVSLDENQRNAETPKQPELDHMNKAAKDQAKFDFQAVDKGSVFDLRLSLTIRRNDRDLESLLTKVLARLNSLYVGGKTSRGFGKLVCEKIYRRDFDFTGADKVEQLNAWLEFSEWATLKTERFEQRDIEFKQPENISVLTAELELDGSVLIRDVYSIEEDEDHAHTRSKSDGKSVIYGTSWAGAIRGGLAKLLKTNRRANAEAYLDEVFGKQYFDGKKNVTTPSKVRLDASYLSGGDRIKYSRVKIDRFTGGAANTALFTNRPHFGGGCRLSVQFAQTDAAVKELFLLALDAIDKGLITLGGETAVGRGKFKVKSVQIDGEEVEYKQAKPRLKEAMENV